MPYVKILGRFGPNEPMRVAYLINSGVGRGQANRRDDTLLVQYLLNRVWKRVEKNQTYGVPGKPPLAIDGVCGADTIAAIVRFQSIFYGAHGDVSIQDGIVDPTPPGRALGLQHRQTYTILGLNLIFAEEHGKEKHILMLDEPDFPNELMFQFYT